MLSSSHVDVLVSMLGTMPSMAGTTVATLSNIATVSPAAVFRHVDHICNLADQMGIVPSQLSQLIGACGRCRTAVSTSGAVSPADAMLPRIMSYMEAATSQQVAVWLSELLSLCPFLSDKSVLSPYEELLTSMRDTNKELVEAIDMYQAGKSTVSMLDIVSEQESLVKNMQREIELLKQEV